MIRIGIDAGGTFTDCVAIGPRWARALKLRSRRDDPAATVLDALDALLPRGHRSDVELTYSTTAATNALLERRGAPVTLVTTAGFEDVIEIGRQARPELYALHPVKPAPLVGVEERVGVAERATADGVALAALSPSEVDRVVGEVARRAPRAIALCLLHAYAYPDHERALAARLRARGYAVSVSSEICPLPREYERTSTTVIDAYVAPALGETIAMLARPGLRLRIMESNGGARATETVRPARTVLSGPAAGVIATEALARRRGLGAAVALDVGGTSTDVALVRDGAAARVEELSIGGLPIGLPSVDVRTVGAGGGSIAWIDGGGALRVGPRSAGADPGPVAYDAGGTEPTLTDAQVVLGRLGRSICGGTVRLDAAKAGAAVEQLAGRLGVPIEAAAAAIVAVAEATMARALARVCAQISVEDATLVAYGGAAGLHAVAVARELAIPRVLVPPSPGLHCARGALAAETVVEAIAAWRETLGEGLSAAAKARIAALREEAASGLDRDGVPARARAVTAVVRARYVGQGLDAELDLEASGCTPAAFAAMHARTYGHALPGRAIEIVRLTVRGASGTTGISSTPPDAGWARRASREVWDDGWQRCARYLRERLRVGATIEGPAIVEEATSTLWLPEGSRATVEEDGCLLVEAAHASTCNNPGSSPRI